MFGDRYTYINLLIFIVVGVKLLNIYIKMEIKVILAILVKLNWVKWGSGNERRVVSHYIGQRPTHDTVHGF